MEIRSQASGLHQYVFNSILQPAILLNKEGDIQSMNRAWFDSPINEQFGEEAEGYLNKSYQQLYKGQEELKRAIAQVLDAQESAYNQKVAYENWSFAIRVIPLKDDQCCIVGALIAYTDITEQDKLEKFYKHGVKEFRLIAEHSKDMIKLTDTEGNVEYASPSHEAVFGYIDISNFFNYIHPDDAYRVMEIRDEIFETKESRTLELRQRNKNGEWIWVETVCSPVLSDEGNVQNLVFITRDITERKLLRDELERMAYFDHLTKIYNRRKMRIVMEETLEECLSNGEQFAILIMDLNKFKWINDTYGHDIGDQVLKEFANRLLRCKGEADIVGRLGGDEFAVVLREISGKDDVIQFIRRFRLELSELFKIPHTETAIQIKSSVGFSMYPSHGSNVDSLIKCADNAMYKEKRNLFKDGIKVSFKKHDTKQGWLSSLS